MKKSIFTSAADVEAAFYDALARRDVDAMMAVWSEDDEVVCIQVDGIRLVNLPAIREYWQNLFASPANRKLQISHKIACANMMLTVHNNLETSFSGDKSSTIMATHVFARGALGWRLVMRHASQSSQEAPTSSSGPFLH